MKGHNILAWQASAARLERIGPHRHCEQRAAEGAPNEGDLAMVVVPMQDCVLAQRSLQLLVHSCLRMH